MQVCESEGLFSVRVSKSDGAFTCALRCLKGANLFLTLYRQTIPRATPSGRISRLLFVFRPSYYLLPDNAASVLPSTNDPNLLSSSPSPSCHCSPPTSPQYAVEGIWLCKFTHFSQRYLRSEAEQKPFLYLLSKHTNEADDMEGVCYVLKGYQ